MRLPFRISCRPWLSISRRGPVKREREDGGVEGGRRRKCCGVFPPSLVFEFTITLKKSGTSTKRGAALTFHLPSVEIKTATRVPWGIIDEILNHLTVRVAVNSNFRTLQSCTLISKPWVPSCRQHLFRTILFAQKDMDKWFETFLVPEERHH